MQVSDSYSASDISFPLELYDPLDSIHWYELLVSYEVTLSHRDIL